VGLVFFVTAVSSRVFGDNGKALLDDSLQRSIQSKASEPQKGLLIQFPIARSEAFRFIVASDRHHMYTKL